MKSTTRLTKFAALIVALMATFASQAVNKVYIADFSISNYGTLYVPVMIENSEVITQVQFDVTLPSSLSLMAQNKEDFTFNPDLSNFMKGASIFANADGSSTIKFSILSLDLTGTVRIDPGQKMLVEIPLAAKQGMLSQNGTAEINISGIELVNPAAATVQESETNSTTVTFVKEAEVEKSVSLNCDNAPVIVNPGDVRQAVISMTNNFKVQALNFDIYVPENVTVESVTPGGALPESLIPSLTPRNGFYRVIIFGMPGMIPPIEAGVNELVVINLKANDEFFANGNVEIKNIAVSDPQSVAVHADNIRFDLISGYPAYENAFMLLQGDEDGLGKFITDAMNTVNEECPLVADNYNFMPFFQRVEELMSAVETAYNNYTLTPDYETIVEAPANQIKQDVNEFVAQARAAQAAEVQRRADNQAAYNSDLEALNTLQTALNTAKEQIREQYAGFENEEAENAVQTQIDNLRQEVEAAYTAVQEAGNYDYTLTVAPVEEAINALIENARTAYEAEMQRRADNLEAYQADIAAVEELQNMLDSAKAEIREQYAGFEDEEAENAVQTQIDNLRQEVEAAYTAVQEAGNYDYTPDIEPITDAISNLILNAQKAKENSERQAANLAAYNADLEAINALQTALDEAKADVREQYPGFANEAAENAIQLDINTMREAVEAEYAAVENEGQYSYQLDTTAVSEAIEALVPAAAEAYRVDYNNRLYNADLTRLSEVQAKYDAILAVIQKLNPALLDRVEVAEVATDIEASRQAIEAEYSRVEEEGFYEGPAFDAESLENAIDNMLDILTTGIGMIYNDANLEGIEIYTLDGQRRNTVVRGQINILRINNRVVKIMVK